MHLPHTPHSGDLLARNLAEARGDSGKGGGGEGIADELVPDLVDISAWRRYCAVVKVFRIFGEWMGPNPK